MEIDTGAAVSIVSDRTRKSLPYLEKLPLQPTQVTLQTYTGESIAVLGELSVIVTCQGINHILPLLVVKEDGQVTLQTYTGESIAVLGELSVIVTCQGINHILPLLVVKEDGPSLIGRN